MAKNERTPAERDREFAVEWWRDCTTTLGVPVHAVARALHVTYRSLRRRLGALGIAITDIDHSYVPVDIAYQLLAETFPVPSRAR